MKTLFLSILDGLFTAENKQPLEKSTDKIFLTTTDSVSGRTLIIEEDDYAVRAHLLSLNKEEIDFEGYLCSVVDSNFFDMNSHKFVKKNGPLSTLYSNEYSYVKNLEKNDITVDWQKNKAIIFIKNEVYLIMDMKEKMSYSKSLSIDCEYGKRLEVN